MAGKKKRKRKDLRRVAISSTERSVKQLDELSEHLGLDLSKTLSVLLEEFVSSEVVRVEYEAYSDALSQNVYIETGRSGIFRNYMLPGDFLTDKYVEKFTEEYGLSDFIRTLIYFNYDRKLLPLDPAKETEIVEKIEAAGLKVVNYNQFEKVLNIQVDISHLLGTE